jgi:hypothetical protein
MNLIKSASAAMLALSFLAGCGGGPEGMYSFDKENAKKAMEAEIAKKPKEEQAFAGLALALIDALDMKLEIKSGGKWEMKMSAPSLGGKDAEKKEESETGDWTVEGDTITLKGKKDLKCKFDSKQLSCDAEKDGPPMVFKKG